MKFSGSTMPSVLSVTIRYSQKKVKQVDMEAGGKGQLSYEIVGSQKAELTLRPPVCSSSQCSGKIKYYIMTSPKKVQLYSQLGCPSSYFTTGDISKDPIKE